MADDIVFRIRGKNESKSAFSSLSRSIGTTVKSAFKLKATVSAAAFAVSAFTITVANGIDSQAKFAGRLNESVTSLSEYQHVAGLAGINTQTFNLAIQRSSRRIAEAAKGTGEAAGALRELGIDAATASRLALPERMGLLADRLSNVKNEGDRVRLAFKLFDSEGVAMLQMLNNGSDAMKAAAADARFLGLSISEEAAAQAELFTHELGRATGAMKGTSNAIGGELMPLLTGLARLFADTLARSRQGIVDFTRSMITGFFTIGEVVQQTYNGIGQILNDPAAFNAMISNIGKFAVAFTEAFARMLKAAGIIVASGFAIIGDSIITFAKWAAAAMLEPFTGESAGELSEAMSQSFVAAFARAKDITRSEMSQIAPIVAGTLSEAGSLLADTLGVDLDSARLKAQETIESLSLFATTAGEQIANTAVETSSFMDAMQIQQREFMQWLNDSSTNFAKTLNDTLQGTIGATSAAVADSIVEGTSLAEAMQNVLKNVVKSVLQSLIQLGIQQLILAAKQRAMVAAATSQEAASAVGLAGANMFKSWAGAPWPISLGAPAAAAGAVAGASAAFSAGAAAGAALGGSIGAVAHGGLTSNPEETTALIRKDERVISPRQNEVLMDTLTSLRERSEGAAGGLNVENINITVDTGGSGSRGLEGMTNSELADKLENAIITALDRAARKGITPEFNERRRR